MTTPATTPTPAPAILASFTTQDPLTGYPELVIRCVKETTTIRDLMAWHQRTCGNSKNWKPEWFSIQVRIERI